VRLVPLVLCFLKFDVHQPDLLLLVVEDALVVFCADSVAPLDHALVEPHL
jgi:hypothetical protein